MLPISPGGLCTHHVYRRGATLACDPPLLMASTTYRSCITCRCRHGSPTSRCPRATVRPPVGTHARSHRTSPCAHPMSSCTLRPVAVAPCRRTCGFPCGSNYVEVLCLQVLLSLGGETLSWLPSARSVGAGDSVLSSRARDFLSWLVLTLLMASAARDPHSDPRGQPHLPLADGSHTFSTWRRHNYWRRH